MDFFYDQQIRRYILQFIRTFADIKIQGTPDENGNTVESRVPIKYGDINRMVAHIIKQNSENTIVPSPMMSAWVVGIELAKERRQDPYWVSKINTTERKFSKTANEYTGEVGNQYTIDRYMPVPYTLKMQLDVWSKSTTTKLQILEQILTVFNPMVQLQQNDNPLDWSNISEIELTNVTWSNRSIPVGTDDQQDVASLTFDVSVWINPPSKVKRQKIIKSIIHGIYTDVNLEEIDLDIETYDPASVLFGELSSRVIVTPGNYKIGVGTSGAGENQIILLNQYGVPDDAITWESLFTVYGNFNANEEFTIRLKTNDNIESEEDDILGTVTINQTYPNILDFVVDDDTLPSTLIFSPITKIIDPTKTYPGSGLPAAAPGQKYLLINSDTNGEEPAIPIPAIWGIIDAWENDIITYNGLDWVVIFDSRNEDAPKYVKNIATGHLLKFNGTEWINAYYGEYSPGYWKIEF